ncbi:conserved hypothetical protein [Shewanella halifaxensis HAW-EB4]|uniref:DUF4381 domain-containing protein n=1 Tax=Shewanella halifaxensis (strain HAW-EB4) TaxID=458817 RepID=B0TL25_SHEHH|nr:DUF4381 domain-containing protein [Shewanella halifaxensis]ABZ77227.1 conserved hypothetical protein [Shewanella halifaxensis HAW-EB4]
MTNPVNPALASMQDIQTPIEIGLWPLAYGYWISLLIIILVATLLIVWFKKRRQVSAAKRAALVELAKLNMHSEQYVTEVSSILKRAAMSYCSRSQVAQLCGDDWDHWLNAQVATPQDELCRLLAMRFQPLSLSDEDKQALKHHAQNWLKGALPLSNKQGKTHNEIENEVSPC